MPARLRVRRGPCAVPPPPRSVCPAGTVHLADGSQRLPNGMVLRPDGTMLLPDGSVKLPDGRLVLPDGTFAEPHADGSYELSDGTVLLPDGGIQRVDGTILTPDGSVINTDGSVLLPDGTTAKAGYMLPTYALPGFTKRPRAGQGDLEVPPGASRGVGPVLREPIGAGHRGAGAHRTSTQGCIGREGASVAVPEAVGGGCRSGWGRFLSVTNAIEACTCR